MFIFVCSFENQFQYVAVPGSIHCLRNMFYIQTSMNMCIPRYFPEKSQPEKSPKMRQDEPSSRRTSALDVWSNHFVAFFLMALGFLRAHPTLDQALGYQNNLCLNIYIYNMYYNCYAYIFIILYIRIYTYVILYYYFLLCIYIYIQIYIYMYIV